MVIPTFGAGQDLPFLSWKTAKHVSSAFAGATTDAHGSIGEKPTYTLWTVTGRIYIRTVFGVCGTGLAGTGEAQVGTATNTVLFLAATEAVNIDVDEVWADAADPIDKAAVLDALSPQWYVSNGEDIIETTTSTDITSGQMDYFMVWAPAEEGATIVSSGALS